MREIISDLRPAALDALGTQAAVETLVERVRGRADIEIELSVDLSYESGRAATRHVPTLEAAIYRIAQESIANTIKHAEATRVIVALVERGDVLTLSVEDDGRGFDVESVPKTGFGLIGIRERVELLGGSLTITSRPGAGPTRSGGSRHASLRRDRRHPRCTAQRRNARLARRPFRSRSLPKCHSRATPMHGVRRAAILDVTTTMGVGGTDGTSHRATTTCPTSDGDD